jgi:hypothetical protein
LDKLNQIINCTDSCFPSFIVNSHQSATVKMMLILICFSVDDLGHEGDGRDGKGQDSAGIEALGPALLVRFGGGRLGVAFVLVLAHADAIFFVTFYGAIFAVALGVFSRHTAFPLHAA